MFARPYVGLFPRCSMIPGLWICEPLTDINVQLGQGCHVSNHGIDPDTDVNGKRNNPIQSENRRSSAIIVSALCSDCIQDVKANEHSRQLTTLTGGPQNIPTKENTLIVITQLPVPLGSSPVLPFLIGQRPPTLHLILKLHFPLLFQRKHLLILLWWWWPW